MSANILSDSQIFALELRDAAIERVTTRAGRAVLYATAALSFITRGVYLPAPASVRFLQPGPANPNPLDYWFTLSRGADMAIAGMTAIALHHGYEKEPRTIGIYDFRTRDETIVNFYLNTGIHISRHGGQTIGLADTDGRILTYDRLGCTEIETIDYLNLLACAVGTDRRLNHR